MRAPKITPILSLSFLLAAAAPLAAATYVLPSDESLADQAPVIAAVRVADAGPAPARAGIATDYVVEVEEVVKGDLPGSTVVVRVPGGEADGGLALRVSGAPRFAAGERALLFLVPNRDGSYGVLHLFLGAFHADHAVRGGGRTLVRRDLAEGRPLGPAADPPRDLERFGRWLADRAAGLAAERDYLVAEAAPRAAVEAFSALPTPDRVPLRWFRFDGGESAAWRINAGGVPLGAAEAALRAGMAAWNDDPTSAIAYAYAGTTSASAGFARSDGVNAVLFDDPGGAHVPGSYKCGSGGIVALGVAYFYSATRGSGGKSYHEIVEGDVVTNDGSACFFRDNPTGAAEALAHELGHTLGLGHSTERQALMYGVASGKRGARLEHDDRLGAHALY
ncbi:MAG TPA: matrixin family metalloprotease, partial [Thermoanaerobaculia bacterium]|nr:matrixin family metalloprotease [Thermoanaerobaculia bacterium]